MSPRNVFDRELGNLHGDLLQMAELVQQAIDKAVTALVERDRELATKVANGDAEVDAMEGTIESRALRLLLQQQPVAKDLRSISTALKVITDMERVGDHAVDIAEISIHIDDKQFTKELVDVPQMADTAIEMLKKSIDAFVRHDLPLASEVIAQDDEVDALFVKVRDELIELVGKERDGAEQAIDLLMIAKYLERIADHATNIAEWAIFQETGLHKDRKIL